MKLPTIKKTISSAMSQHFDKQELWIIKTFVCIIAFENRQQDLQHINTKVMDTENKKRITPDIDEEKMMNLMVDGVRKDGFKVPDETSSSELPEKEKPVKRERSRTKGISPAEYEEIFFKEVKTTARHGKSVYIDPNHHKKLSRIVQVIGDDNITIYAYLSNLLDHHFQEFEQQITESFNEKNKPIF